MEDYFISVCKKSSMFGDKKKKCVRYGDSLLLKEKVILS